MTSLKRRAYDALPGKAPLFRALRPLPLPVGVAHRLRFRGPFPLDVGGARPLRMQSRGGMIEASLFWLGYGRGWEATSLRVWAHLARRSSVIFDVGANSGTYALAAAAINPAARVLAFEPLPAMAEQLRGDVRANGLAVEVVEVAASDTEGTARFHMAEDNSIGSLEALAEGRETAGFDVTVARLEAYGTPDLLKIDVEEHEAAVLRGLGAALDRRPALLIEVLTDALAADITDALGDRAFRIFHIDEAGGTLREVAALSAGVGKNRNYLLCGDDVATSLSAAPDLRVVARG